MDTMMTNATLPRARTPLHSWHAAHASQFVNTDGWQLPAVYSSVEAEWAAARAGVALADLSAFAKISLVGTGVAALEQALLGPGFRPAARSVSSFDAGGPVLACRLTEDHLLLLTGSPAAADLQRRLSDLAESQHVLQTDVTSAYAGFALVGPHTEALLRRLTALDLQETAFPAGTCAETGVAGVHALLVRPAGLTLPALRVYVAWDLGEYVWERLLEAGHGLGLVPGGLEAFRRLTQAT
jgi:heterotetrameric sarcosine oxidase gamma subunit